MLTDEQREVLSGALIPLYQHLEGWVIADVARRIKKTLSYTRTAELEVIALRELGFSPAKIRAEAMKILRLIRHSSGKWKKTRWNINAKWRGF